MLTLVASYKQYIILKVIEFKTIPENIKEIHIQLLKISTVLSLIVHENIKENPFFFAYKLNFDNVTPGCYL